MNRPALSRMRTLIAWLLAPAGLAWVALNAGRIARQEAEPAASGSEVVLTVDATRVTRPISPYIYGLSAASERHYRELRLPLWRWGGNPSTRYNWEKGNCWNAARDWQFRNGNYSHTGPADRAPSGAADQAIATGRKFRADALITIPTMGWVARDDRNGNASAGVPNGGGPPIRPGSEAIAGYDPTENRRKVSQRSLPRKGRPFADPPDLKDDVVYQDEWVYHLTRRFGKANAGGVRFYAMDNEPDLWDVTHTDMHPVRPDYDELLRRFLTAADAVKDVDPSSQITGPVSWGWTGYFFSPRDRGSDNYGAHGDRKARGDMPFLPWFLQQAAAHDRKTGRRTLDFLDVHYYPQGDGVYGGKADPKTNALRLRGTRALWDASYTDESWIGAQVQLIPRLRKWVETYYPGTKIAINEWNWGADNTLNGGLAAAEVLGVFGQEGVDMACYWAIPALDSPAFFAYKMYRNADGRGAGFGDAAVEARSSDSADVSCFGSVETSTGRPAVMVINKLPDRDVPASLTVTAKQGVKSAEVYRFSGNDLKKIERMPDIAITDGRVRIRLPAYSVTLLRCR